MDVGRLGDGVPLQRQPAADRAQQRQREAAAEKRPLAAADPQRASEGEREREAGVGPRANATTNWQNHKA